MRQNLLRFMVMQVVAGGFFTLILVFKIGQASALSAIAGAFCVFAPSCVFGFYYFSERRSSRAQLIVKRFYRGETLKLFATVLLVALSVCLWPLDIKWFCVGFLWQQLSVWVLPLYFRGPIWRMV